MLSIEPGASHLTQVPYQLSPAVLLKASTYAVFMLTVLKHYNLQKRATECMLPDAFCGEELTFKEHTTFALGKLSLWND